MKKTLIVIILFIFVSCDPLFHDDFIIVNNCNDDINVSVVHEKGNEQTFTVKALSEYLFFEDEWVGGASKVEKINYIFQEIVITKDSTISKINYVDYHLWNKEDVKSSKKFAYYTNVKYYLPINPEDFE